MKLEEFFLGFIAFSVNRQIFYNKFYIKCIHIYIFNFLIHVRKIITFKFLEFFHISKSKNQRRHASVILKRTIPFSRPRS
jgi:hypothetical protein